ncbi:MAG: hypothetical protein LUI08_03945 [Prevotella sp.]|nr:hypothetical protein [Prevotella sp.]
MNEKATGQSGKCVVTPESIYDSLWRCRDFELSHLWQRSIFLTTFLVICFTGYGAVLVKICEGLPDATGVQTVSDFGMVILNAAGIFIAATGFVMSVLWIMMGKGSKAWYEMYERALDEIIHNPKYASAVVVGEMDNDGLTHGSLYTDKPVDSNILTAHAGRFSVSKVNICIGQVSLCVWAIVLLAHTIAFTASNAVVEIITSHLNIVAAITLLGIILALAVAVMSLYRNCESSTIGR